ncbi:indole-3-glycerol phosphate synthase [Virgibacillus pantothenticus]|uniref:Indole-3-glycerol phosphate synthase n=1 Tax=Virgibacillus pantothenticus TaxID=1473 RepID=A0A0L0QKU9_VIRPA|nr:MULTISPECIES: indole-3-glycerol phosphate synthase TrpC [Virgibacillus]API92871.1 indole-3-glycerol phosphate synthase [Virgibacillus sp. 6R]KNE18893.1 indole-3-glycerol phosphate synthase [Virgibacillus pantothenticus]MBS7428384.1 indole-3-glycerol phosphate synthase TrpC [Virgibacillus sp. 19R1-5]MBU8565182.1 indole-3-glycerol phosphate synthase TrpC [Virgibacillus pantothenticus]MBU8601466.1 indole-3-glycerol phosphate synthase TrpC [Virgibacillus pantothenticus]
MTILDEIITVKQTEVRELLQSKRKFAITKKTHSLTKRIAEAGQMQIIAEIKRASPSKGDIQTNIHPVEQAIMYEKCGAAAVSVLTDASFFKGSMNDLKAVAEAVEIPVLCKDFIIHPIQIDQAKAAGASIILLIVAALSKQQLQELYAYATANDLEVICEVHDIEELSTALSLNPAIIGINNRNLKTFAVTLQTTKNIAQQINNPNTMIISESGIRSRSDAMLARDAGADAILVGETLMQSSNIQHTFQQLQLDRRKKNAR